MIVSCATCSVRFNDEIHSTICPHKGIGFCRACDCVICVCDEETTNIRSNKTPSFQSVSWFIHQQMGDALSNGNPELWRWYQDANNFLRERWKQCQK